ncbi:T9SS type A sorting domain-containing protein [Flavobacteriales bacterium]|nr:T9SS type A sorting domain-containing protein [Flavobacteriales bacterium]
MKKLLLIASAALISAGACAQSCTPDANFIGSPAGLYPAGPLGPTCELIAAKTLVTLTDTVLTTPLGAATFYIGRMRVNEVIGLPPNLMLRTDVEVDPGNGDWGEWINTGNQPNQTAAIGCAYVEGTQGAWDAAVGGGPMSDGVYPLEFVVDARVITSSNGTINFLFGSDYWISTVDPAQGGGPIPLFDTLVIPTDYADISTTIAGNENVDPSTPETYSVPNDPNVTYVWTATNGTITGGQGTNEVTVEWAGSGTIEVDLTDGGCSGTDQKTVTANPTGLDEVAGINASVYPNPSNGVFNLQLDNTDAITVRIMDVSGKVLRNNTLSGSTMYSVDMQTAPTGVYILELETANGKTFKRLIKQ